MIDPRALQQHFNKVRQREQPQRQSVPRVPDSGPLTAVQVIPILDEKHSLDTSNQQKELLEVIQIEPITITVPISVATTEEVNELAEEPIIKKTEVIEKDNPYGYSVPESQENNEEYNPYGYYSGPLF